MSSSLSTDYRVACVVPVSTAADRRLDLSSTTLHPWPFSFTGAVAKVLDDAGIPNVAWGDVLNWWRGNPNAPQICGLIVPTELFESAIHAVGRAGLQSCHCKDSDHISDPSDSTWLPVHFEVLESEMFQLWSIFFLCPSDRLLDLIPLRPTDRNPASLTFDYYAIHIYNFYKPVIPLEEGMPAPPDYHVVKALTTVSLIEALLLLAAMSPPLSGVDHPFSQSVYALYVSQLDVGQDISVLRSPSLQSLWKTWYIKRKRNSDAPWESVRRVWRKKLFPDSAIDETIASVDLSPTPVTF